MHKLNKFLAKSRESKGLSQDDVGKLLGFSNGQYISNIERNECSLSPKHFKRIAKLYGVSLDDLVDFALDDIVDNMRAEIKEG